MTLTAHGGWLAALPLDVETAVLHCMPQRGGAPVSIGGGVHGYRMSCGVVGTPSPDHPPHGASTDCASTAGGQHPGRGSIVSQHCERVPRPAACARPQRGLELLGRQPAGYQSMPHPMSCGGLQRTHAAQRAGVELCVSDVCAAVAWCRHKPRTTPARLHTPSTTSQRKRRMDSLCRRPMKGLTPHAHQPVCGELGNNRCTTVDHHSAPAFSQPAAARMHSPPCTSYLALAHAHAHALLTAAACSVGERLAPSPET
jgi:hypothetical protein